MSRFTCVPLAFFACAALVSAQTAADPNEGLQLALDPVDGTPLLSWWGRAGRVYFIEHSSDLYVWQPMPTFEAGADAPIAYGVASTGTRFFARVRWVTSTLAQFQVGDYDGDSITNAAEASAGLNPFARDSDLDGLPDDYEIAFGLNPTLGDASADLDGDDVPNAEDARPSSSGTGRLSVAILNPLPGATW